MKVREKYLKSKFNHYIALDDIMKFKPPMRMNTILIKELYNYAITQDGFILNKKTMRWIEEFYDYEHKEIVVRLPSNKSQYKEKWYSIKYLIAYAYYGVLSNKVYLKDNDWKNPTIESVRYEIYDIEYIKNNNNVVYIDGIEYRRFRDSVNFISQNGIVFNIYLKRFIRHREEIYGPPAGYCSVSIKKIPRALHRVVYESWVNEIKPGYEINHINHIRWDCSLSNLEELTKRENIRDMFEFNNKKMVSDKEVLMIDQELRKRVRTAVIAEKYNVSQSTVQAIKSGRYHKCITKDLKKPDIAFHKDSPNGITPDHVIWICEEYLKGRLIKDIYKELEKSIPIKYSSVEAIIAGRIFKDITKPYIDKMNNREYVNCGRSLDSDKVHEICKLLVKGIGPTEISKQFGVTEGTIMKIKSGTIWTQISNQYDFSKFWEVRKAVKLSGAQVHEICKLLLENKYTTDEIASKYGITRTSINDIIRGDGWPQIGKQYDWSNFKRISQKDKAVLSQATLS